MIDLYYSILFYLSYQSLIYLYYLLNYNYHLLFLWSMFDLHHLPNHNCTILLHTISLFSLINIWLTPLAKSQLHRSTCLINLINHIYYIIYLIISIIDLYYLLDNNYPFSFSPTNIWLTLLVESLNWTIPLVLPQSFTCILLTRP